MMATKYFGTDGVRGEANIGVTVAIAYRIGRYLGTHFKGSTILIGRDTRKSGMMFESALISGITESGGNVDLLGVCPTPCVAYLTKTGDYQIGVMISASHNPFYDNGIKLFNNKGEKVSSDLEYEIECYIDQEFELETAKREEIGIFNDVSGDVYKYISFLKTCVNLDLSGYRIVLDLANGSATTTSEIIFRELGAEVIVIANNPNGLNINLECGSTHPEVLCQEVINQKAHIGFAFDGDADRVMASDENGELIDGDKILYLCGQHMSNLGVLKENTIVTTVMANIGLYKALDKISVMTKKTQVGDKYVYECMKEGYNLGGEQSGHIIFRDYATTGDGLLTALKIMEVIVHGKKQVSELLQELLIYPQLLINQKVNNKEAALSDRDICELIEKIKIELGDSGQILVRPSGTEPLIRVMVEAETNELCKKYVHQVIELIQGKGL